MEVDGRRPLAVVDIDGVVADVRHRLHLIETRPKRWSAFFAAAAQDPPLAEGVAAVQGLRDEHEVVWLTGRPERNRALTERWLRQVGLPVGRLLMRPDEDWRPARHYKAEALRGLAVGRDVAVVLDDDPVVVERLQQEGYPARLTEWLPHSRTLRTAQEREGRT